MGNFDGPASSPETKLLAEIQGGLTSTRCGRPHTVYAVLLAVSPESRGGQIAEAGLNGGLISAAPPASLGP